MKNFYSQISDANKILVPAMQAVKFPDFEVSYPDGKTLKLPIRCSQNMSSDSNPAVPKACLLCLSFRASSQVRYVGCGLLAKVECFIRKLYLLSSACF